MSPSGSDSSVVRKYLVPLVICVCVILLLALTSNIVRILRETKDPKSIASGSYITLDSVDVHYTDTGPRDGMPLFFIHGGGIVGGAYWQEAGETMATVGYRIITIDLPPFGSSQRVPKPIYDTNTQATRVIDLMKQLQLKRVVLIGHSTSASVAAEVAIRQRDRIASLVLVSPTIDLDQAPSQSPGITERLLSYRPIRDTLVSTFVTQPFFARLILQSVMYRQSAVTDERVKLVQDQLQVEGTTQALGYWLMQTIFARESSAYYMDSRVASGIDRPTLVIWGAQDQFVPYTRARALKDALPDATLITLPNVGHFPHVEDTRRFTNALLKFLTDNKL